MPVGQTRICAKFVSNMSLTGLTTLWATNAIKAAFMTATVAPLIGDSDPRWGAGGAQNYATNEVVPSGNYVAGGIAVAGTTSTLAGAVTSLNCTSPIAIAALAANPTTAAWLIFYDSTDAGKRVIGFMDLGGTVSLVPGLQINVNGVSSGTQPVFQGTAT